VVSQWFLRTVLVKGYRFYFYLRRKWIRSKPKIGSSFLFIFTNNFLTPVSIVILALIITSTNIHVYAASRDEEFGNDSLLYLIVERDELGYLFEEKVDFSRGVQTQEYSVYARKLSSGASPLTNEEVEEATRPLALTHGGTALIKPNISGDEEAIIDQPIEYLVQIGDTIYAIAEQFGVSLSTILWENNLTVNSYIQPGQKLVILPVNGVTHFVKRGETISRIAKKYDANPEEIVVYNRLTSIEDIGIGQKLIIPGGRRIPVAPRIPSRENIKGIFTAPTGTSPLVGTGNYIWPTTCKRVTQYFGWRHTGMDIACGNGVAIYASHSGVVVKAADGWNGGYGRVLIIEGDNGVQTLYGHNSQMYVKVGEVVTQGQVIAAMGSTGRSTGPHVHFEIRQGGRRTNPLSYVKLK